MKKWKYKTRQLKITLGAGGFPKQADVEEALDSFIDTGWELIAISQIPEARGQEEIISLTAFLRTKDTRPLP